MPLTTCALKEFLIESKLNGFFFWGGGGGVLLHLDLDIFIGEVK